MNLLDYIRGNRKGENAHRIEKESMRDPFIYEALEGYDSIKDDHIARIEEIQKRIHAKSKKEQKPYKILRQVAAACIIGTLTIGGFLLIDGNRSDMYAQEKDMDIMNIYVPAQYYAANIAIIAQNNTEQVKTYKPIIKRFTLEEMNITANAEDNFGLLADSNMDDTSIDIYLPKEKQKEQIRIASATKPMKRNQKAEIETLAGAMAYDAESSPVYAKVAKEQVSAKLAQNKSVKRSMASAADALILPSIPEVGIEAYDIYLKENIKYPQDSECKDTRGDVILEFSINEEGIPYDIKVISSLCPSCDREAIRLLKEGGKWNAYRLPASITVSF